MKKILGLDLGSTSIGWAFIEENKTSRAIRKLGVRIIPYSGDEKDQFTKGQAITLNKDRTLKRTARKTMHRYKMRRTDLLQVFSDWGITISPKLMRSLTALELYGLRAKAVSEPVTREELARILFHLNQKRGYKSSRQAAEEEGGKKLSDYLTELKERKELLEQQHITIGQYFYSQLKNDTTFRVRQKVFPRECYIDEFNRIWNEQKKHHPQLLTEENKSRIRDEIIYYQRRLKSQKKLVSECRFELHHKVAPKSSPLYQVEKIWESINTISLTNKFKENYTITPEQKQAIFEHLDNKEKLTLTDLLKILGLSRTSGWHANEQIKKAGLQGNTTKARLLKEFKNLGIERPDLLEFHLEIETNQKVNKETGEVSEYEMISPGFEKQPLYRIWHLLYSVDDPGQVINVLQQQYHFTKEQAEQLSKIDFTKAGFGAKSARAIRKLLPGLMQGLTYAYAAEIVGYNHSDSITKEENLQRQLLEQLPRIPKNSLRQPVVEKILNQLVNLINAILQDPGLGRPDEIRVELARELKQNQEERNKAYQNTIDTDKRHKLIRERLQSEYPGLAVTRKVIEKFKLFEQQDGLCMYSGKTMQLAQVLRGEGVDVDHIIPQSKLFDDSFQNKVLAFRTENEKKDNFTAYDYMKSKGDEAFRQYLERVDKLLETQKITRSKQQKLLMSNDEIPSDFINRQLNETRYIAKEARQLLQQVCLNVHSSTGMVTDFLRHQWGYNEVLKQLGLKKWEEAGLLDSENMPKWSKRDDHRHHALDALVVACTKQSIIQRLNTLNSSNTRTEMLQAIQGKTAEGWQKKKSLSEMYIQTEQPFTTQDVAEALSHILISIKPGKRVAARGKNKATGQRPLTPRGQLHKESVYGRIRRYSKEKIPLNGRFNKADLIANEQEKKLVLERLTQYENDPKKAFKNLEKDPIWLDAEKTKSLTAVTVWEDYFVIKYNLDQNFKEKDVPFIVDDAIRQKVQERFDQYKEQKEHPLKNLENDPIWLNEAKRIPIKTVRCFTGLSDLVPLHSASNGITKPMSRKTDQ
ncbi:MAG TPA: type II CRISPR RNA-guided endonuclease Cas9, partial [Lacibacter sp.]|nr:type II CRISPR RNA-guided endonuclease Cas9 [Lacibacter sp.]